MPEVRMLTKQKILRSNKEAFTFWISPEIINGYVGSNIFKYPNSKSAWIKGIKQINSRFPDLIQRYSPLKCNLFCIPDKHYKEPIPITSLKKYKRLKDLIIKKENYMESIWFLEYSKILESQGVLSHKGIIIRTQEELHNFFLQYVLILINSMISDGYKSEASQPGYVMIGKNGEVHKSNAGDHRFIIISVRLIIE